MELNPQRWHSKLQELCFTKTIHNFQLKKLKLYSKFMNLMKIDDKFKKTSDLWNIEQNSSPLTLNVSFSLDKNG